MAESIPMKPNVRTYFVLYDQEEVPIIYPTVETPSIGINGGIYQPDCWVIFCGHCGNVWGKRFLIDQPNDHWNIRIWPCRNCGNGSLWDAWNKPWNMSLPPELLHREMDIIAGWWDEGIRTYNQFFQYKHFRRIV